MMVQRHEKSVNDDAESNKQFDKRVEYDEGNPFLKDNPRPTAVPHAEYINNFHNKS